VAGGGGGAAGASGSSGAGGVVCGDGGAASDGSASDGGTDGGGAPPKKGIHVQWSMEGVATMLAETCEKVGAKRIYVRSTSTDMTGNQLFRDNYFPCSGSTGTFDILDYTTDQWLIKISARDALNNIVGNETILPDRMSPCDRVACGNCVRDYTTVIFVPDL
jgi:hypothetical protein